MGNELIKIEDRFCELKNEIENSFKNYSNTIDRLENGLTSILKGIRLDLTELKAHSWQLRGVEANALTSFLDSIEITIEQGYEEKYILENIKNTLKAMNEIRIDDYIKTTDILEKMKPGNSELKKDIEILCNNLPQYMYVDDPRDTSRLIRVALTERGSASDSKN